jgi:predicted nucleic acid-binding Zn ribbon protein
LRGERFDKKGSGIQMRVCRICGKELPKHKRYYCVECGKKVTEDRLAAKRKSDRRCVVCGKELIGLERTYCEEHRRYKNKSASVRYCRVCGKEIPYGRYKYCDECAKLMQSQRGDVAKARIKLAKLSQKSGKDYGNTKQCNTCKYWSESFKWCNYADIMGVPRMCEPSPNCTKYERG